MTTDAERKSGEFLRKRMFEKLTGGKGFDLSKKMPIPNQETPPTLDDVCVYTKAVHNPESTTANHMRMQKDVAEKCTECKGYNIQCPFYSTAP